jgi:hypothetical protein
LSFLKNCLVIKIFYSSISIFVLPLPYKASRLTATQAITVVLIQQPILVLELEKASHEYNKLYLLKKPIEP